MKNLVTLLILILSISSAFAQKPVHWKFSTKKVGANQYELHLSATIDKPYHIYSQNNSEDGPLPTTVTLKKNPLLIPDAKVVEVGKLVDKYEEAFKMNVRYFEGKVDFVARIKTRTAVNTNVAGSVHFMACTQEKCLAPETVTFNLKL